jgi:hypothetical protein
MTLNHAIEVKARHEHELLGLDCVQGVGVGEAQGRPAIMVYVDGYPSTPGSIPQRIEDVPVVVEQAGGFRSF